MSEEAAMGARQQVLEVLKGIESHGGGWGGIAWAHNEIMAIFEPPASPSGAPGVEEQISTEIWREMVAQGARRESLHRALMTIVRPHLRGTPAEAPSGASEDADLWMLLRRIEVAPHMSGEAIEAVRELVTARERAARQQGFEEGERSMEIAASEPHP